MSLRREIRKLEETTTKDKIGVGLGRAVGDV